MPTVRMATRMRTLITRLPRVGVGAAQAGCSRVSCMLAPAQHEVAVQRAGRRRHENRRSERDGEGGAGGMRTSLPPESPAQVGCVSLGGGMYRVGAHAVKTQGKKGKLAKAAI